MYLSAQTAGSEREKRKEWGRGLGVRSEEEEKKGRLIIKVFQLASPWRSGTWRGFRGFGLSTSDLMPGMEECGSQSPWSPPTSPRLLLLLLLSHSSTPPDTLPPFHPPAPSAPRALSTGPVWPQGRFLSLVLSLNTFLVLFISLCLALLPAQASSYPLKRQGPVLISL